MKFLVKKTPDGFIKTINDEISTILNRNFDSFFPEFVLNEEISEKMAMPVEIHEKENEYGVKAELPGVKKEDLEVEIDKNCLTLNAKRHEEHKEDTKGFRKSEFKYGEFSRTVYFPEEINVEATKASLKDGVLCITAPKKKIEKQDKKKLTIE